MKTILDSCHPRPDVLTGDLREDMFAAKLKAVMDKAADPVYQDPAKFWGNTFPTEGMKALLQEVMGRLSGVKPTNSPFIRLETSFGGGKTHNLIALYHLTQCHVAGFPEGICPKEWLPTQPWAVAGMVGNEMDPANGLHHGSLTTRTLWGELAWQIGGEEAFKLVQASDVEGVAPGTPVIEQLVGDRPTLVMLDEFARYLRVAKAVSTANKKSDLAEQSVAFLMALIEVAATRPNLVVVLTLADSQDAFSKETESVLVQFKEAQRISARQERVLTPTGETEIARIVTHRLFEFIDEGAGKATAEAYGEYLAQISEKGVEVPANALTPSYRTELANAYPFNPELLRVLDKKTSTIPNFQRTRGALRLLARVVKDLWQRKEATLLIGTHHLNLGDEDIKNDLTSRLDRPVFRQVIEADIASRSAANPAHAQKVDQQFVEAGKPPFAGRATTTIMLHSLAQGIATGIEPSELNLSVLQPGDDPHLLRKALSILLGEAGVEPGKAAWFLHYDGRSYRFKTEPSLEKVVQDEMGQITRLQARTELDHRIKSIWKKGALRPCFFPSEAADLDDDAAEPKLAILHFDAVTIGDEGGTMLPELVKKLDKHAGNQAGFRRYRNNVCFLVADKTQVERMSEQVTRLKAIERLVGDANRMNEFSEDQRKRLQELSDTAQMDVRIAITRAYRHLFYPSATGPKTLEGMEYQALPAQAQGQVEKDQTEAVVRHLHGQEKVLLADDNPLPAVYLRSKAWPSGALSMTTDELRQAFAERIELKWLLNPDQLKKSIKNGIEKGVWIYFDAAEQVGYGQETPAPLVAISTDAILYDPVEARAKGIRMKGEAAPVKACPACGKNPCACEEDLGLDPVDGEVKDTLPAVVRFDAKGAPGQLLQTLNDSFLDQKAEAVGRITFTLEGNSSETASDLKRLGLAIPQMGKGQVSLQATLIALFGQSPADETFKLEFKGGWDRYKRLKDLAEAMAKEASQLQIKITITLRFPDGLPIQGEALGSMRDVLSSLGLGTMSVEAVAHQVGVTS